MAVNVALTIDFVQGLVYCTFLEDDIIWMLAVGGGGNRLLVISGLLRAYHVRMSVNNNARTITIKLYRTRLLFGGLSKITMSLTYVFFTPSHPDYSTNV